MLWVVSLRLTFGFSNWRLSAALKSAGQACFMVQFVTAGVNIKWL